MQDKEISLSEAIKVLSKHLREDKDLYRAYKDNIAMAFQDEYARQFKDSGLYNEYVGIKSSIWQVSNIAASNFLDLLIKE